MTSSNPTRRARSAFAVTTAFAILLAACTSTSNPGAGVSATAFGSIPPPSGTSRSGGSVTVALNPGQSPNYIYPNEPSAENGLVVGASQLFLPLYASADLGSKASINSAASLADEPTYSADRKTVTMKVKPGYTWANGRSVDAADVVFSIDLIRASLKVNPDNWTFYTPGGFPDDLVSAQATGKYTVELRLTTGYNPGYFLNWIGRTLIPLPSTSWNVATTGGAHLDYTVPANAKAIFTYLDKQSKNQSSFAANPLWQDVDGPYRLSQFDSSTGSYTLARNPRYTGPHHSTLTQVRYLAFTSTTAILSQVKAGSLDVATLDNSFLPQLSAVKRLGYNVYGAPGAADMNSIFINFDDATNHFNKVIGQLYVRQALQHLIDQPGYVRSRGIYDGAAAQNYATAHVGSPYAPSFGDKPPYPYDVAAAKKLLTSHGWKVHPGGSTVCAKVGSGQGHCGVGIPAGQTLTFNFAYANSPATSVNRDVAFISEAKRLGISINGMPKALNYIYANYDDNAAPAHKNDWAMEDAGALTFNAYPATFSLFSSGASSNYGHYKSGRADALLKASVSSPNPNALIAETTFLARNLPVLFLPNPDNIVVWKTQLSGPKVSFADLTQGRTPSQYWYYRS